MERRDRKEEDEEEDIVVERSIDVELWRTVLLEETGELGFYRVSNSFLCFIFLTNLPVCLVVM